MDGKTLVYLLRQRLNEDEYSEFISERLSYTLLNQAADELVGRTGCLRATTTITTVADQQEYILPANFLAVLNADSQNRKFVQFTLAGSTVAQNVNEGVYADMRNSGLTSTSRIPGSFCIMDYVSTPSRVEGVATAISAKSEGECTLTCSAGMSSALLANVSVGDIIHNVTDVSSGYVIAKPSSLGLTTCLFDGTDNGWTTGDRYIIQPQGRMSIFFDRPLSTSGDTITVEYLQRPAPVYSPYRAFRIPAQQMNHLVDYAAEFYKYRDRNPKFGDAFGQKFDNSVRRAGQQQRRARSDGRMGVNLKVQKR
jgi:hypothetical protein